MTNNPSKSPSVFARAAGWTAHKAGSPQAFGLATGVIIVWAALGPVFHYSDTWQLVINTNTTIVTFLMVFLIQNTQNRDSRAVQMKLDELIRAHQEAHNSLLDLENLAEEQVDRLQASYARLAKEARDGQLDVAPEAERAIR